MALRAQDELQQLFEAAGFTCEALGLQKRDIVNHKHSLTMRRRWLQACLYLNPSCCLVLAF